MRWFLSGRHRWPVRPPCWFARRTGHPFDRSFFPGKPAHLPPKQLGDRFRSVLKEPWVAWHHHAIYGIIGFEAFWWPQVLAHTWRLGFQTLHIESMPEAASLQSTKVLKQTGF